MMDDLGNYCFYLSRSQGMLYLRESRDNPSFTAPMTISTYNIPRPISIPFSSVKRPDQEKLLHPRGVRWDLLNY